MTLSHNHSHYTHLPWRDLKIYYNTEANSYFMTSPIFQCYNAQLPSTPTYLIIKLYIQAVTTVTNHGQSYNRHAWMDTQQRVTNHRPGRPSQNATAQSGARMHKPRQATPEFSVNMHWVKEAAEAQILRQAEFL